MGKGGKVGCKHFFFITKNYQQYFDSLLLRAFADNISEVGQMVQFFVNPFPNEKNSDSSKLKAFADDNFELDENGRKLSKRVGNTVGKGEIARHEQFLLFPQCFQKTYTADT